MNNTIIYTITSLHIKDVFNNKKEMVGKVLTHNRDRLVGFYSELETAKKCVVEDWAGFAEAGYYNYIIIERTVEGLYNLGAFELKDIDGLGEWWYYHDYDNRKWIPCGKPEFKYSINGFGIG